MAMSYKNSSLGSAANYQRKGQNMFIVVKKRRNFKNYFYIHITGFHVSNFEKISRTLPQISRKEFGRNFHEKNWFFTGTI